MDQHQAITIMTKTICECTVDNERIETEQAKQMAICIVAALTAAGLKIVPVNAE